MDYHEPKWVGDSNYSHFSSCGNFIGTSRHNSWHLICKFPTWQILLLLRVRYSVDRGPWRCCLRLWYRLWGSRSSQATEHRTDPLHWWEPADWTRAAGMMDDLRRLRDTSKPEDERLTPWKFSEVFWSPVVWRLWGYSLQSERKGAPSCIPYLWRGIMLWGLFGFWKQYVLHLRMLLWPIY